VSFALNPVTSSATVRACTDVNTFVVTHVRTKSVPSGLQFFLGHIIEDVLTAHSPFALS
jgi:hypothetical protein